MIAFQADFVKSFSYFIRLKTPVQPDEILTVTSAKP